MKKLITLIAIGSVLFSGALVAQEYDPVRARDGSGMGTYGVPVRLYENQDIQECIARYEEARGTLTQEVKQLRERLANASPEDQAAIKEQIRDQLRAHCDEQREFRKGLRGIMRQMRQERLGRTGKTGG